MTTIHITSHLCEMSKRTADITTESPCYESGNLILPSEYFHLFVILRLGWHHSARREPPPTPQTTEWIQTPYRLLRATHRPNNAAHLFAAGQFHALFVLDGEQLQCWQERCSGESIAGSVVEQESIAFPAASMHISLVDLNEHLSLVHI
jgi:hypothetical protein